VTFDLDLDLAAICSLQAQCEWRGTRWPVDYCVKVWWRTGHLTENSSVRDDQMQSCRVGYSSNRHTPHQENQWTEEYSANSCSYICNIISTKCCQFPLISSEWRHQDTCTLHNDRARTATKIYTLAAAAVYKRLTSCSTQSTWGRQHPRGGHGAPLTGRK